ncbi:Fibronectin type-III domain-containing protein [Sulfidibacter corallicola]|uniref:Fibronectin type-III domain-containing protein n=1 Tax=Sulfidibacter corallicola TaxID=2818388 RepID=A0A8A4TIQ6_SULCO|nr:hypothetical protein [Sulfidibacter corallicola]QTD49377.1 hypothetical protein J3U87_27650 [Sulfidibacter corallicola]
MLFAIHRPVARRCLAICLVLFPCALLAQTTPEYDSIWERVRYRHADLEVNQAYQSLQEVDSTEQGRLNADLRALGANVQASRVDGFSGRWGTVLLSRPLMPGNGVGNKISWNRSFKSVAQEKEAVLTAFTDFLGQYKEQLHLDPSEFGAEHKVTFYRDRELVRIYIPRAIDGIPVRHSNINAAVNNGNLVLFGAHFWGDVAPRAATISEAESQHILSEYLGESLRFDGFRHEARLEYIPMAKNRHTPNQHFGDGYDYRLCWVLAPEFSGEIPEWEALVDAENGEVLSFQDTSHYFAESLTVSGGVYPLTNDGVGPEGQEQDYPFPFLPVTTSTGRTLYTDGGGNISVCNNTTVIGTLAGRYVVINDVCGTFEESTDTNHLDLGFGDAPGDTDCVVAAGRSAGNTKSSRSAYYEINRIVEIGRGHLPDNDWVRSPLPVQVNIDDTCNATGGPGGLRFFKSGGGCNNTGEIAGVFDHEWGHGMDGADATPGISTPGEGIADLFAAIRLNTSCIGRNFRTINCSGFGDPCLDCTGVRDIDWGKRQSNSPHNVTWANDTCKPFGGGGPCGGSVHCEGQVYAEAVWDLWKRDLPAAFPELDERALHELTAHLIFQGSGGVGAAFQCNQGSGGCGANNGYLNYLAADDDDGNLDNGTPHMTAIFAAFDRHGIACDSLTVQNSGCANGPTAAPTVQAAATSLGAELTWNAVPNADTYRVYRSEGVDACALGKYLLTETAGTSFTDAELAPSMEYTYLVVPMGAGQACFGPSSGCVTVTPEGPEGLALGFVADLEITSGDGDIFLDNCEDAVISVSAFNLGNNALTNVRITEVRFPNQPDIVLNETLPKTVAASLTGDCTGAPVTLAFTASGLSFNAGLEVEIVAEADGVDGATGSYTFDKTQSNWETLPVATFDFETDMNGFQAISGTFTRSNAIDGAGGSEFYLASSANTHNVCDVAYSPLMELSSDSTLSIQTHFDIEEFGQGWWDRANLALVNATDASRSVIAPDGGRTYNASGQASSSFCNNGEDGFAAAMETWAESTFSAGALDSANQAGRQLYLELRYGTDGAAVGSGFRVDSISLTNVNVQVPEASSQSCCSFESLYATWPDVTILNMVSCVNLEQPVFKTPLVMSTTGH